MMMWGFRCEIFGFTFGICVCFVLGFFACFFVGCFWFSPTSCLPPVLNSRYCTEIREKNSAEIKEDEFIGSIHVLF